MRSVTFVLAAGVLPTNAFKLLLTSYGPAWQQAGAVQVLEGGHGGKLAATSSNQGCGAWPTWSDISLGKGLISCVDEMEPGSLNMLQLQPNGDIKNLTSVSTIGGPVSTVFYNDKSAIALAHYSTPAISTFRVTSDNKFVPLQNFSITTPPGPDTDRQDKAHIHQAVLDPTGAFLVFPNLGSDVVHVFSIDKKTNMITEQTPLKARPGYGPRHATFWKPSSCSPDTFMFLINEIANRLVSYRVSYAKNGTLGFTEVDNVSSFGNKNGSADANAGEIAISPDNRFIITSNRLSPINITNPDPSNSTAFASDTIATFKPSANGTLQFVQLAPSGGLSPRHFSLNCNGTMVAVANFQSRDVAVYERDVESGLLGKEVARGSNMGAGSLTHVAWLENDLAGF